MVNHLVAPLAAFLAILAVPAFDTALAAPPSRADYADQCAAAMGEIPAFNCLDGDLLDISVNGVRQSQPVPSNTCDKPVQLGLAGNQCVPFSHLLRLSTGRPTVTTYAICRKYFASSGPDDPRFDDISVIQHDLATGRTCFFQSRIMANLDGRTVPSPSDRTVQGAQYWLENESGGPGGITCTGCHAADPFVWSPFVAQKADIGRWNPLGRYDSNFANLFGEHARIFQPAQPGDASCTACHRFGRGPKTDAACSVYTRRYTGQSEFSTNRDEVLMPPAFGTAAWHSGYDTVLAQIQRCCANPDLAECQSRLADGAPPP